MKSPVSKMLVAITAALTVNAVLFHGIGVLHQLFNPVILNQSKSQDEKMIVMERIQKPEKKPEKRVRKIRTVHSLSGRQTTGKMHLRFSPDLSTASGTGVAMHGNQLQNMIFKEGETDEPLIPVKIVPLPYPQRARDLGIEGNLVFEMIVGRDGKVKSFDVLKSPHPSITSAARKTVQDWRFKPAKNEGIPVEVRVRQEIEFNLR